MGRAKFRHRVIKIGLLIDNFDLHIFQFDICFVIFGILYVFKFIHDDNFSVIMSEIKLSKQPRRLFAYQWLDNVKTNKYAKFDPNMPCGSRFMGISLTGHNRRTDAQQSFACADPKTNFRRGGGGGGGFRPDGQKTVLTTVF